jgi:hypothetical protein
VSRHKLDAKLHCRAPFRLYCEVHVDPEITNTMDPRTKWAVCLGPTGNLQGSYKCLSLAMGKKVTRIKFTEMLITESIIEQVEKMAVKDGATKGLSFKSRKGIEYEFDNDEEYEMLVEPEEPAPYPDIPAKAPGMLTECEEEFGANDVVQEEMEQTDEERAILAAENLGLDFSSVPMKVMGGEVIEILDDEEEEAISEFMQEEILMKLEPDQEEEVLQDAVKTAKGDEPGRLARAQNTNRQYKDYELYVTVEEEEIILATVGDKHDEEDNDEEELAAVAHYVMTHYA